MYQAPCFKQFLSLYGGLIFGMSLHLLPYFVYASSQALQMHWLQSELLCSILELAERVPNGTGSSEASLLAEAMSQRQCIMLFMYNTTNPPKISPFCTLTLGKDPKMHINDPCICICMVKV